MKKIIQGLGILLIVLAITGCADEKEETNTKKTALSKFEGKYTITFSDDEEELNEIAFKEEVSMKKCASKKEKNCLQKGGNDNQLSIMEDEEGMYLSVPISYLIDEKETKSEDEDILNARICFEWDDYGIFTQVMCPPKDSNLFEKEEMDTKYYFRLAKEAKEKK